MSAAPLPSPQPVLDGVVLDHVAVAVDDLEAATSWWHGIGASPSSDMFSDSFTARQVRLSNGGKVELLTRTPGTGPSFIDGFLQRFGSGLVHHLTLKVPAPLDAAVDTLGEAGYDVVDVNTDHPDWHESFMRPSQAGGVIVQVAWASGDDEAYARREGQPPPAPVNPDAPALERVVLGHPDLDAAQRLWTTLGAVVRRGDGGRRLTARWADSPITVEVRSAFTPGPLGFVLSRTLPADHHAAAPALLDPFG